MEDEVKNNEEFSDNKLHTILVCPAYLLNDFEKGIHLQEMGLKMSDFNSGKIKKLKKNDEFKRFHYLSEDRNLNIPELVVDFKHFYTIPRDIIYHQYNKSYLGSLNILFRENLSQRFSNFLSRIGLPSIKTK